MNNQVAEIQALSDEEFDTLVQTASPNAEPEKPAKTVFTPLGTPGAEILDNLGKPTPPAPVVPENGAPANQPPVVIPAVSDDALNDIINGEEADDKGGEDAPTPAGKAVPFLSAYNKLLTDGTILPFDDETKKPEEYTDKDWVELLKVNIQNVRDKEREAAPTQLMEALSPSLQYALQYELNGGQDLKGLFAKLSDAHQVLELDETDPMGQEQIVKNWLELTNYGTPEEIKAEIESLRDMPGQLEKKAKQFKPKLDGKKAEIIAVEVQRAEAYKKTQQENFVKYQQTIFKALEPGVINGLKITPKKQQELYDALTKTAYATSAGRSTNLLGHLLEKYQTSEPKPELILEAVYLLSNPEEYRKALKESFNTEIVENTVRTLKTGQERRSHSGPGPNEEGAPSGAGTSKKGLARPSIFKR